MDNNYLKHYGVLGMRWGVRRSRAQLDGSTGSSKKKKLQKVQEENQASKYKTKSSEPAKKTIKDLSDTELREKINRLELEKRYKELSKVEPKTTSKGKAFVMDVLEKSGKNIATQLTTYAMGRAVNGIFKDIFNDEAVVNPKKGQKDK